MYDEKNDPRGRASSVSSFSCSPRKPLRWHGVDHLYETDKGKTRQRSSPGDSRQEGESLSRRKIIKLLPEKSKGLDGGTMG